MTDYSIVIPTIGRPSLNRLLAALDQGHGPRPSAIVIVDDRPLPKEPLRLPPNSLPVTVVRSGGRGPAAARNTGWRQCATEWINFLDDDVVPSADWCQQLTSDLRGVDEAVVGSQGRLVVQLPQGKRPSDDERRTLRLAEAQWITADMAYRRRALVQCGGFDERFPRAYREDSDLGLRMTRCCGRIVPGTRTAEHPIADGRPTVWSSIRAQRGNRDDALMRRKYGRRWRAEIGESRGRLRAHVATTAAALVAIAAAITRHRYLAVGAATAWLALTLDFTLRRIAPGPRTAREVIAMVFSSILIPPVATAQRAWGTWLFRHERRDPPLAVLFDRDDTLIKDGPYLNDPRGVVPLPDAERAVHRLRKRGLLLGVITNQSGVAKGLITGAQLFAVNTRVEELLGPFDNWQVCLHDGGCQCRKPAPGMVIAAAAELGLDPRRCVVIGDIGRDVEAAQAAQAKAILVPTERTLPAEIRHARSSAHVAATLNDAVTLVLKGLA
ncbi:HAD-IIIA family hydrolase [Mycobacterium paraterrae]|uniref:D,D-heptose 1,7-bisphosphate phosphatase n=1 Tax=Mycobacterium paraterrae TaxID=577492 RepID=A0ABY3VEW5_9MYCO|nr:HAD-IIIA family hydrolase [Mycobacterium paraterrae]UMB67979.1 HAD-IIIA family hydrolase [Mycobacterium paraterrae]